MKPVIICFTTDGATHVIDLFFFSLEIKKKTCAALNIFMSKNLLESFLVEKGYQKIL